MKQARINGNSRRLSFWKACGSQRSRSHQATLWHRTRCDAAAYNTILDEMGSSSLNARDSACVISILLGWSLLTHVKDLNNHDSHSGTVLATDRRNISAASEKCSLAPCILWQDRMLSLNWTHSILRWGCTTSISHRIDGSWGLLFGQKAVCHLICTHYMPSWFQCLARAHNSFKIESPT